MLGIEEAERTERECADGQQEDPAARLRLQDRPGDGGIDLPELAAMRFVMMHDGRLAADLQHQIGRDDHGDEEGEDHRSRGIRRDGAHIGPHHARNEEHGEQGGHHGQRRDDGRIADFRHGLDGRAAARSPVMHAPVPRRVLDDDDGVVDENADGEDQREERNAVQRIAHDIGGEERQQDRHRNDDGHHQRLAPPDGEPDEQNDRNGRQPQMIEQLVRLLVGRFAIVAGDFEMHVAGDQIALEHIDALEHGLGNRHGVGARALGDGQRDRGDALDSLIRLRDGGNPKVGRVGCERDIGDIADIDRAAVARGQQKIADGGGRRQRLAGNQADLLIVLANIAAGKALLAACTLPASCCSVTP